MMSARTGEVAYVVDSVSFPTAGYASPGAQSAESVQPSPPPADNRPPPATPAVVSARAGTSPSVVVDFSSGTAVIDWRDHETQQVLVQLPMRSALAQVAGASSPPAQVGKHVDTEA